MDCSKFIQQSLINMIYIHKYIKYIRYYSEDPNPVKKVPDPADQKSPDPDSQPPLQLIVDTLILKV